MHRGQCCRLVKAGAHSAEDINRTEPEPCWAPHALVILCAMAKDGTGGRGAAGHQALAQGTVTVLKAEWEEAAAQAHTGRRVSIHGAVSRCPDASHNLCSGQRQPWEPGKPSSSFGCLTCDTMVL